MNDVWICKEFDMKNALRAIIGKVEDKNGKIQKLREFLRLINDIPGNERLDTYYTRLFRDEIEKLGGTIGSNCTTTI